jgi:hypothetical protein
MVVIILVIIVVIVVVVCLVLVGVFPPVNVEVCLVHAPSSFLSVNMVPCKS